MHKRASNAFSVLQATAVVVSFAIILWSLGFTSFRFAEAANVSSFSDTLSTSQPSVAANHTITFTTPSGVANNSTITLDFSDGPFVVGSVDFTDIDIATTSDFVVGTSTCVGGHQVGAGFSGTTLTLTFCNGVAGASLPANATTTIQIGLNADGGDAQLTNPAVPGVGTSYEIALTAGADTGTTHVAILDVVTVSATVDTYFEFTVTGVGGGNTVNGTTTTGTSTASSIPFGVLLPGVASTAAQDLVVQTNAKNGYTVTVIADGQLDSATQADIDGFIEGAYTSTPTTWQAPTPTVGDEWSYGHWGLTSNDADLGFGSQQYVSASTSPVTVLSHNGPVDGVATPEAGTSTARIGYTVQITSLQEAATDYEAVLTYVATPVF